MFARGHLGVVAVELERHQPPAGRERAGEQDRAVAAERAELEDRARAVDASEQLQEPALRRGHGDRRQAGVRARLQRRLEHGVAVQQRLPHELVDLVPDAPSSSVRLRRVARAHQRQRHGQSRRAAHASRSGARAGRPRAPGSRPRPASPPPAEGPRTPAPAPTAAPGDRARRGARAPRPVPGRPRGSPRRDGRRPAAGRPPGVGSSRMRRRSSPASCSAATVRSSDGDIATTWSTPIAPFGCSGAAPAAGRSEILVASPSSSVLATPRSDHSSDRPVPARSRAGSRITLPSWQLSPSSVKPSASQAAGSSASAISSMLTSVTLPTVPARACPAGATGCGPKLAK